MADVFPTGDHDCLVLRRGEFGRNKHQLTQDAAGRWWWGSVEVILQKEIPVAETDLNDRLRAALKMWDPVRVENSVGPGTPDINYLRGWIESKYVEEWPARADTVLRLEHYVPKQRAWHVRRCAAGGTVFVALEVASEFHLFAADMAARYLGTEWTRADCRSCALLWSPTWDEGRVRKFFVDYHAAVR